MPTRYRATLDGIEHELEIAELSALSYRVKIGDAQHEVDVRQVGPTSFSILVCNRSFDLDVVRDGEEMIVASRGGAIRVGLVDATHYARQRAAGDSQTAGPVQVKALMPGRIVNVLVKEGDEVAQHQGLVLVEAMKMENEVKSPKAGKVTQVRVSPTQTVEKGELLVVIE
ncbi:MAG: acetyl-CoA carboxylase biotin carboxyl carrier protein subunit [Deltaproteobacteria bacterium]|nr:acetyl-CoA carboxylase biotin carboxyl carrier protein subunit [Deltaproteobacteria bacterium]